MVSDILTLSSINDINSLNINNTYIDIEDIIKTASISLETMLYLSNSKNNKITSEIVIDENIYFHLNKQNLIKLDEFRLKQILLNFII